MKKIATGILLALSALMILDTLNAGHALVVFLLAGVIPGTNLAFSASQMLSFFALLIGFTLSRISIALMNARDGHRTSSKFQSSNGTILSAHS